MSLFNNTGSVKPRRSAFDLSYTKKFTCDMGQIIPIMVDEVVPGDHWTIGNMSVVRFAPLVAPILHKVTMKVSYHFVPYRLLWNNSESDSWEGFITGGKDGRNSATQPLWHPTNNAEGSLWDYLGFPPGIDPEKRRPVTFPRDAYNLVWNTFLRDETLQDEVALNNEDILNIGWPRDYFVSALIDQQRGVAPSLPISGHSHAVWTTSAVSVNVAGTTARLNNVVPLNQFYVSGATELVNLLGALNDNTVDLSSATTFNVADLRLAFQIQKWMERNNRAGYRYVEFLQAHYDVGGDLDQRLQRPEFIGMTSSPVVFSEVLQTSSTDATSPQGNLAGHGITATHNYAGKYFVKEFGLIIGLMWVVPDANYQDGINRQWLRQTRYDYFAPEFANLSEQAIENVEICAINGNTTDNQGIFGYQGRFDEMRFKPDMICSGMRTDYSYWHLGRIFDPANPPELNEQFIECVPRKDIFAVPSEPGLIVQFGNILKAVRPLPMSAEPGLIDHV